MPALVEIMRPLGSEIQQQPQYSFRQPTEYLIKFCFEKLHITQKNRYDIRMNVIYKLILGSFYTPASNVVKRK